LARDTGAVFGSSEKGRFPAIFSRTALIAHVSQNAPLVRNRAIARVTAQSSLLPAENRGFGSLADFHASRGAYCALRSPVASITAHEVHDGRQVSANQLRANRTVRPRLGVLTSTSTERATELSSYADRTLSELGPQQKSSDLSWSVIVNTFAIPKRSSFLSAVVVFIGVPALVCGQPSMAQLDQRVALALEHNGRRVLSTERHSTWDIMHGVLGFGADFPIRVGSKGRIMRAVDFICSEATVGGQPLFSVGPKGAKAIEGYGAQGHPDQFLAILAQTDVPASQPIKIDGATHTVVELVSEAQVDYDVGHEASWTLIALATYLPINATWKNQSGRQLTIADLVSAEVAVEPRGAACGGTHNLYALAFALARHKASGGTLIGEWQQADAKLAEYVQLARAYQNPDGSFSSNYFVGPGSSSDPETVLYTTGHMLEWLTIDLPDSEWQQPWVTNAFQALVSAFERVKAQPVSCGALYHACHALRLYHQRRLALKQHLNWHATTGRVELWGLVAR